MRKAFIAFVLMTLIIGTIFVIQKNSNPGLVVAEMEMPPKGVKPTPETDSPDLYLELHRYLQTEYGAEGPAYEAGYELKEYKASYLKGAKSPSASRTEAVTWDEKGPGNVSGRTPGIWIDPTDANINTWVLGSSGGGIWRTSDGGQTWSNRTNNLPNLTISIIEGSAANPNVVYAGTGRRFNAANPLKGNGILKSTDRGQTWEVLESTLNDSKFANVSGIAVNPDNENELVVSTNTDTNVAGPLGSFILKSDDGGVSWSTLFTTTSRIQQVLTSKQDFNVQFASVNSSSIIRSLDGGENWTTVFTPDSLHNDSQSFLRVEMAIAPTNDRRIFLAMEIDEDGREDSELYMSDNQGASWARIIGKDNVNSFGNWLGRQGWFDNTIAVHPYVDTCVFVAGVSPILKITLDSARNDSLFTASMDVIKDANGQYDIEGVREVGSKGVHVDHHNLILWPINESTQDYYLFNGNDGGLAVSKDKGATFTQTGAWANFRTGGNFPTFTGYNTVEFYGVDKKNGEDRYVAGSQDNGSWLSGVNPDANSNWVLAPSGDGFFAAWHYTNPNLIIESAQNNSIWKSTDEGQTWRFVVLPVDDGPFVTEVENSKQDPDLVFMSSPEGLLRSTDFGDTWDVLSMPETWAYSGYNTRVAISLINPDVVWSGASIGGTFRIARSTDGGDSWTATAGLDEANRGAVSNIVTHPTDENTAFALFSQANGPKVIRTTDGGQSWSDISGFDGNNAGSNTGFPDVPTYSLVVMPFDTNIIWVGTQIGIVESLDGGATWALKTDHNLPAVSVWDMRIVNDEVVIATHGRGIWSATLPELAGYEPPAALLSPRLSVQEVSFSTKISGRSALRSAYDSTLIIARSSEFEDQVIFKQEANNAGEVINWTQDLTTALANTSSDQNITIIHQSWSNGAALTKQENVRIVRTKDPVTTFENAIDGDIAGNFFIDGFSVSSSLSVEGNAFHTPHPYDNLSRYLFTSRTPFLLNADTAVLRYSDVAIVEPGEDFGELFYDFVAIEALKLSTDNPSSNWVRLIRYDARQHNDWLAAYNTDANAVPSADLFKNQMIDLYESGDFVQGDTILVRFLLESDPAAEGYGWVVDNILYNARPEIVLSAPTDLGKEVFKVFPNPVQEVATFNFQLKTESQVSMDIYDLEGRLVKQIDLGLLNRGSHNYEYLTNGMEPGIYVSILRSNEETHRLKWILRE